MYYTIHIFPFTCVLSYYLKTFLYLFELDKKLTFLVFFKTMSTTDALAESLKHSSIPFIHELLIKFPHPLISWSEVITTRPNITHFYWIVIFIFITGFTHLICHLFGHAFAQRLIGWQKDPPLPSTTNIMKSSNFLKLGQIVRHRKRIKISNLNLDQISIETDLTTKEITKCIAVWNRFHAENRCQRRKLQEYLFPIIYKSFAFYLGCYLFYDKPWVQNIFFLSPKLKMFSKLDFFSLQIKNVFKNGFFCLLKNIDL